MVGRAAGLGYDGGVGAQQPYRRLSGYLRDRYGERVYKVSLRGGFTCPNRDGRVGIGGCTYCSGSALEPIGYAAGQTIEQQLEAGIDYIARRHRSRRFIAYFHDYSATYASIARLTACYRPAIEHPEVVALAVSTRPDCLSSEILELLGRLATLKQVWVELGLQLADDTALAALNRGHTVADFCAAVDACHTAGLPVCAHVILGLPGASRDQEHRTAALLAELGLWGVKLHAFHVISGTAMAARFQAGELSLLTRDQYVERLIDVVECLPAETVIHRLTGEAPPRFTIAPEWTINKLAVLDAVNAGFARRNTWQGRQYCGQMSIVAR